MKYHVLIKAIDKEAEGADYPFEYSLECPGAPHCTGWQECAGSHLIEGHPSSVDGPYDCDPDAPCEDQEEYEFHGVVHTWHYGYGWTVPYMGCVVREHDLEEDDLLHDQPPGRYLVDIEWPDPEECYPILVGPEE